MQASEKSNEAYWQANIKLLLKCMAVWFSVSFLCGILLVEPLNNIPLGGFKLGFWFSQQGAIYGFLVLIFVYARQMEKLDKKFDVDED
ncbi:DUF4212 domain-containing protein [Pelagibaculum spongiae]|uniref:DUF4212 domain-containing protein n=1 Tax=Pelagibaculum spongiae TaxID=2080658 RepID=A0A2V1GU54_9GAMM|nr:DUF4212 domain-containing protein [Pelagibaculum spongiae]PVZ69616.1 DUF4212 domain-containing protein [Pelagibaculum spongiae]